MFIFFLIKNIFCRIKYGIMIDAGSSGTRAHIYKWESSTSIPDVKPAPNISNAWFIKKKIPLSNSLKEKDLIKNLFSEIINFCIERIPKEYLKLTRIFVYATGGMRLLNQEDQEKIINLTYNYLKENSPFKLKNKYIRIISGIEEGLFGWLSTNHLLGNFINSKPTYGSLDMGGASFQIALEVDNKEKSNSLYNISIGKKKLKLFTHSYLGYGVNQAIYKINKLISTIKNSKYIENPCYSLNYQTIIEDININGTGNFEECSKLIEVLFIDSPEFSFIKIPSIKTTKNFIAMSSFYYVNEFFNLNFNSTLNDLKNSSINFCLINFQELIKLYSNNEFISNYCWYSIYQYNLLTKGYKFNDNDYIIKKFNEINGIDLSWTIGAMLNEVAEIDFDDKNQFSYFKLFSLISFIIIILLLLFIFETKFMKKKKKKILIF